jgi:hypothetical protein
MGYPLLRLYKLFRLIIEFFGIQTQVLVSLDPWDIFQKDSLNLFVIKIDLFYGEVTDCDLARADKNPIVWTTGEIMHPLNAGYQGKY